MLFASCSVQSLLSLEHSPHLIFSMSLFLFLWVIYLSISTLHSYLCVSLVHILNLQLHSDIYVLTPVQSPSTSTLCSNYVKITSHHFSDQTLFLPSKIPFFSASYFSSSQNLHLFLVCSSNITSFGKTSWILPSF